MRDLRDDVQRAAAQWVAKLGPAGAALGGACCLAVGAVGLRHVARVVLARRRLYQMLSAVAGEDARIVITGATSGIGEELARQLRWHPSVSLLLGCRDTARAERRFCSGADDDRTRVAKLDLLDFDSVQAFTDEAYAFLNEGGPGLRLLVNNAGVMQPPPKGRPGGMDATWMTNFLGPFLLTELLGRLRATKRGAETVRVVHVGSRLEKRSELDEASLEAAATGKGAASAYADSKRALMYWTSVRAQNLAFKSEMFVHVSTPGMVDTRLGRHSVAPWLWPLTKPLRMVLLRSTAEGALSAVACALSEKATENFARYYDGEKELENIMMQRMGDKQLANRVVKWATVVSALDQRHLGYDR